MKKIFKTNGSTFSAMYTAEKHVRDMGLCVNSMERNAPIAITNEYIGKWRHLNSADRADMVGVITSNDYREGEVEVTIFDADDNNPYASK